MESLPDLVEWRRLNDQPAIQPDTLIIGLGNPILGDDGIGWHVAARLAQQLSRNPDSPDELLPAIFSARDYTVEIDCLAIGGLALMERLIGYRRAIIIDSLVTGQSGVGTVTRLPLDNLPERALGHMSSAHDTTLQNALKVGRAMGAELPGEITIIGIETQQVFNFSDELSPELLNAVPTAVNLIMELLK